ncbi:MAG: hypothetical protein K2Y56_18150 [Methylobacterium sp.]|uniref:hypothetical protein n=1 Tax=Methylobacterium sp. TaxID=409 RepID=UPI0025E17CE0|nr:hypothetical protein [Methylobacterium sp.]MBX9933428.1 hypothetical protein [Methylobacterium sp.]
MDAYNTPASKNYINQELKEWAKNFEIPQVEIPGYWKPGWQEQKNALEKQWSEDDYNERSYFKNNWDADSGNNFFMLPNIGTGYRFEDFEQNGIFYDWGMDGQAKPDSVVDPSRRTTGSEKGANGWLTTDVPLQEGNAIVDHDVFSEGNANVDF